MRGSSCDFSFCMHSTLPFYHHKHTQAPTTAAPTPYPCPEDIGILAIKDVDTNATALATNSTLNCQYECWENCQANSQCAGFTFNRKTKLCKLYAAWNETNHCEALDHVAHVDLFCKSLGPQHISIFTHPTTYTLPPSISGSGDFNCCTFRRR